jgi:hypothetical protein
MIYQYTSPAGVKSPQQEIAMKPRPKRVDQMTRDELKAEMKRRLPCCAPAEGSIADGTPAEGGRAAE